MLGLNNAGKTTILYQQNLNEFVQVAPTTAFNVEQVEIKNVKFQVWDLAGQSGIRPYWRSYYPDTQGFIFVIDSTDHERQEIAKQEFLLQLEEEEQKDVPVLVLANKQDMPKALNEGEISNTLGLNGIKDREWSIYKTSAVTGVGLKESQGWLVDVLAGK